MTETDHSTCPFCRNNHLLQGDILASTQQAYLIENTYSRGNYLIIPEVHVELVSDLPDNWWSNIKELVKHIPELPDSYNVALNYGEPAGQSVKHLHFWVVPRLSGKHSSGKGLTRLMHEVDENPLAQK